jgi:hypothetical protein
MGRFITRDPWKGTVLNPQSLNWFTYCYNNPLKYVDFLGLSPLLHDEIQKITEDQNEEKEDEEEVEWIDANGNEYDHEGGRIQLLTDIAKKGNVGVAIGQYRTLSTDPGIRVWINHGPGLVIFFYDENDQIAGMEFISFDGLEDKTKREEKWKEIKELLKEQNVDLNDFDDAREALEEFCSSESRELNIVNIGNSIIGGAGSVALGAVCFVAGALSAAGVGSAAVALGIESYKLSYWADILDDLDD